MADDLTPADILARITSGDYGTHEEGADEWDDVLNKLIGHHGDAIEAFATILKDECGADRFDADDFSDQFEDRYRQHWDSAAAFAEDHVRKFYNERTIDHLNDWIDWKEYADSPEMADYTFAPAFSGVHVFE